MLKSESKSRSRSRSRSRSNLPNWLTKKNSRSWANIEEEANPNSFKQKSRSRSKAIEPKAATAAAIAYGHGNIIHHKAPKCQKGATCADPECTFFHGVKQCDFAAGKQINTRKRIAGGKPNPQFGKPMPCGKGAACEFNHRNKTLRSRTERKIFERARLQQAPVLLSENDLVAAYPDIEYKAADAWSTKEMSRFDRECLVRSLEKSPAEVEEHNDFIEIKFKLSRSR